MHSPEKVFVIIINTAVIGAFNMAAPLFGAQKRVRQYLAPLSPQKTEMHQLAHDGDWVGIIDRCKTHPQELSVPDDDNHVPLELIFSGFRERKHETAEDAVEAMAKAAPATVCRQCNTNQSTALHPSFGVTLHPVVGTPS
jgi:hypothetical protein